MKRLLLITIIVGLLVVGCDSGEDTSIPSPALTPTPTQSTTPEGPTPPDEGLVTTKDFMGVVLTSSTVVVALTLVFYGFVWRRRIEKSKRARGKVVCLIASSLVLTFIMGLFTIVEVIVWFNNNLGQTLVDQYDLEVTVPFYLQMVFFSLGATTFLISTLFFGDTEDVSKEEGSRGMKKTISHIWATRIGRIKQTWNGRNMKYILLVAVIVGALAVILLGVYRKDWLTSEDGQYVVPLMGIGLAVLSVIIALYAIFLSVKTDGQMESLVIKEFSSRISSMKVIHKERALQRMTEIGGSSRTKHEEFRQDLEAVAHLSRWVGKDQRYEFKQWLDDNIISDENRLKGGMYDTWFEDVKRLREQI